MPYEFSFSEKKTDSESTWYDIFLGSRKVGTYTIRADHLIEWYDDEDIDAIEAAVRRHFGVKSDIEAAGIPRSK